MQPGAEVRLPHRRSRDRAARRRLPGARRQRSGRPRGSLADLPQEAEYLLRATQAYRQALALYERIPGFSGVARNLRRTRRVLEQIEVRLSELARAVKAEPRRQSIPMGVTYTTAADRDVRRAQPRRLERGAGSISCWPARRSLC